MTSDEIRQQFVHRLRQNIGPASLPMFQAEILIELAAQLAELKEQLVMEAGVMQPTLHRIAGSMDALDQKLADMFEAMGA